MQNSLSFPKSLKAYQSSLIQELRVLTLANLCLQHLQGIQVVPQHCIHKILHLLRGFELYIAIDLHCIVKCLTVSSRGETNRQGWQSNGQGKMLVLSEGDVSMGINSISSPQVNVLTL